MQVILLENHSIPAVSHTVWYRVGGADDYQGRSGLAHYNEHMMFQGTDKVAAGEFSRTITTLGGQFNAFTGRDFTAYYVTIAKENLPKVMELEADRMINLAPTPENFAKERQVIIEERRMSIENRPGALLAEEMQAALFRNSPYQNPLIGWKHEMENLSRGDVLAFHKQFYNPANAVLVVGGDINRAELSYLADKYYGEIPAGEKYVRNWNVEPPQSVERHIKMSHPNVKQPQLVRYYTAPSVNIGDKDAVLPLSLLAQILGGGTTSKFYQDLVVKQKIATEISLNYDGISQGDGILQIYATPAEGVDLSKLEASIDKAIAEVKIGKQDLPHAKTLLKAETIYARDGIEGMARIIGFLNMANLPLDYFNKWAGLVDNVTLEQVQQASKNIFNPKNSVTGYLLPL